MPSLPSEQWPLDGEAECDCRAVSVKLCWSSWLVAKEGESPWFWVPAIKA